MTKRNARAREVAEFPEVKEAGDFYFLHHNGERIGMVHRCPCGCDAIGSLYFRGKRPAEWGPGAEWDVTGEWPTATLNPSIGFRGSHDSPRGPDGYHWHGYLKEGIFEEC